MTAPRLPDSWALDTRAGLPDSLRVLIKEVPRDTWQGHENFGQMVQFWLQRHLMFRQLGTAIRADIQARVANDLSFGAYTKRLSQLAGTLLNELHMHHHVEDQHYFPQLIGLDARVERGFDLLEQDHGAMDGLLHQMATGANAVLQGGEIGIFGDRFERFSTLLERHLTDEEEIVVPVILNSGFNG